MILACASPAAAYEAVTILSRCQTVTMPCRVARHLLYAPVSGCGGLLRGSQLLQKASLLCDLALDVRRKLWPSPGIVALA